METQLKLIVDYVYEKKGIWITPIPPQNAHHLMVMEFMANVSKEYFENKKKTNGV